VQALPPDSEVGELVCRNPFPSRPLGLLGDGGRLFHETYFGQNPGAWTHGDLIEFDADGRARIHGRSDSLLNVGGFRIGPADLYRVLRGLPEVRQAMAVEQSDPDVPGRSRIVLLVVLRRGAALDGRLTVRIRRTITQNASPGHVPELVVQVDELPTTHSGKGSETAARDAANGIPVANADALRNPDSLEAIGGAVAEATERRRRIAAAPVPGEDAPTEVRLRAIWEGVLGVHPLQPHDDFFDLGGTSLAAVRVFQVIHDRLGVDLPPSTLLRARTPAALAAVIDSPADERVPTLVALRDGSRDRPLFLTHTINGDVLALRRLALRLDTDRPVYGLQARGLDPRERPQTRVEEMAETYVEAIRSVQPTGPYTLAGYSFGGLVALEMARRLRDANEEVDWLGLIDPDVHHAYLPPHRRWWFRVVRPLRFLRAGLAAPRTRLPRYARLALLRVMPSAPVAAPIAGWDLPPLLRELEEIGMQAFRAYRPGRYDGNATLFLTDERRPGMCNPRPIFVRTLRGGLRVERLSGGHVDLVQEPHVGELAARLVAAMERADRARV
jgi:acetoacetyl-CoA synthetase